MEALNGKEQYKMGRKNSEIIENIEPVVETTEEPVVEPTEEPVVEPTVEPVVEPTENYTVGVISKCDRLNIRQLPTKQSNVLTVLSKGTELNIDLDESTDDFYCVHVLINNELVDGYCVKEFIEIK